MPAHRPTRSSSTRSGNRFLGLFFLIALYLERGVRPMQLDAATRVSFSLLGSGSIGAALWSSSSREP